MFSQVYVHPRGERGCSKVGIPPRIQVGTLAQSKVGTPSPPRPGQDGGGGTPRWVPLPPSKANACPSTCYTARGMLFALMQEDFLVRKSVNIGAILWYNGNISHVAVLSPIQDIIAQYYFGKNFFLFVLPNIFSWTTIVKLYTTIKSSCVNARGILTAAYQVFHVLSWEPPSPAGVPPST